MVIADKETVSLDAAYVAAHEGAILVDRSDLGVLKFTGATRLDLIHRMSTQVVNGLASGAGTATILTTDIGRMIDRLRLYAASDAVYAVTGENNAGNVAAYLQRFVFYNDDFHSEDLTAETAILGVYGTHAPAWLRPLFGDSVDIPRHHWRQHDWDGVAVYLHRTDPVAGEGYLVMVDRDDAGSVTERLLDAGIIFAGPEAFEYLRIEAGLPRFGHEITEDYIPLEANLWADVSFDKGCYTGQEIIARMESRGRLAKQLARLQPAKPLAVGAEILADGRNAGVVTSAADGPAGPLALGYVKTKALDEAGADYSSGGVALQPAPLPRNASA